MNMDKYFMRNQYEQLHNHNKAKHNKTVCIFLGIYCINVKDLLYNLTIYLHLSSLTLKRTCTEEHIYMNYNNMDSKAKAAEARVFYFKTHIVMIPTFQSSV